MAIISTVILVSVGILTMIGVTGNELRLFHKDKRNSVHKEEPKHSINYEMMWDPIVDEGSSSIEINRFL